MIKITDERLCCGCEACAQVCPKQCISLNEDSKGFLYPLVDKNLCIDCGLCEAVCPFLNLSETISPIKVVSAINPNEEIRMASSSGGIFTMLAENIIKDGGVVFGACFDKDWGVKHDYTDKIEGLGAFRGAKYTQSVIGQTYKIVKSFLVKGKMVLFTGTGCQISGLKLFLRKEYDNLITVEIACHGVPSSKVWRAYLDDVTGDNRDKIKNINFRDKRNGWNSYGIAIATDKGTFYEKSTNNLYMQSFLRNLNLRPSCTNCPAKHGSSGSDIIIGDFWRAESIHPEIYDDKGCSIVIVNSQNGEKQIDRLNVKGIEITYEEGYRYNPGLIQSARESRYASLFWKGFKKYGIDACKKVLNLIECNKLKRILALAYSKLLLKDN